MPISFNIEDGRGTGNLASVSSRGELIVNKTEYSCPFTAEAAVINTGYNFTDTDGNSIGPKAGKQFVVTEILVSTNRDVGATSGALINIYEADSPTSTVVTKNIIEDLEMIRNQRIFMSMNMILTQGKWLNIKTDDNTVRATIWGYYIDE